MSNNSEKILFLEALTFAYITLTESNLSDLTLCFIHFYLSEVKMFENHLGTFTAVSQNVVVEFIQGFVIFVISKYF